MAPKKSSKNRLQIEDEEVHPAYELRKLLDTYVKACDRHQTTPLTNLVRRYKAEQAALTDGQMESHIPYKGNDKLLKLNICRLLIFTTQQPPSAYLQSAGAGASWDYKSTVVHNGPSPMIFLDHKEPLDYPGICALLDSFKNYRWMEQLSFWKVKLGDDGAMVLAEFLKTNGTIGTLEIVNAALGPRGCSYLGRVLTQNDSLSTLILDHNNIGDEGVLALGDGMKWNSKVAHLSMQYCAIGSAGGDAIAKFIIRSSSVQELILRGNSLGPVGVKSISQAMPKNMVLKKLDLSDNVFGIDLETIEALRDGIEANDSLTSLDISLNSMIPTGSKMLLDVLKGKPQIVNFELFERMQPADYAAMIEAVQMNMKAQKKGKKKGKGKGKKKA